MSTIPDLESRLRRGLRAAGENLPPAPPSPPAVRTGGRRPPSRRGPRLAAAAAVLVAVAAGAVGAGLMGTGGDDRPAFRSGEGGGAAARPAEVDATNGMVPGRATIVDLELRTYDAAGTQTGTVDLSRFRDVAAASSDLDGGWVVCGQQAGIDEEQLVWLPADGEPVVLDARVGMLCEASSVHVVDSAAGPTVVHRSAGWDDDPVPGGWRAIVLATGEERALDIPAPDETDGAASWSVSSDRFLVALDGRVHLYDLATGEELPAPPIALDRASDVVLSGDGTSMAAVTGPTDAPSEVVVYDLATGAERFREAVDIPTEGASLSYDGTTLAYSGSYAGERATTVVVDVGTGARRTLDAHTMLL